MPKCMLFRAVQAAGAPLLVPESRQGRLVQLEDGTILGVCVEKEVPTQRSRTMVAVSTSSMVAIDPAIVPGQNIVVGVDPRDRTPIIGSAVRNAPNQVAVDEPHERTVEGRWEHLLGDEDILDHVPER